jgi:hypothetical protein
MKSRAIIFKHAADWLTAGIFGLAVVIPGLAQGGPPGAPPGAGPPANNNPRTGETAR